MSRGDSTESATIDIDSFDGILMNRVKTDQDVRRAVQVGESDALHGNTTTTTTRAEISIAHAPIRPTRPKSSSASMSSSRTNSFSTRLMGEASGDPRRVAVQMSIEEGKAACKENESTNVLASSSRLIHAVENLTVQVDVHLKESTELLSSEVRNECVLFVLSPSSLE